MKEMKNAWFWFLPPLSSVHFTAAAAFYGSVQLAQ